jgi:predicted membrane-bound spermidine synthase
MNSEEGVLVAQVRCSIHPHSLYAQASSPFACREAFWCIFHTLQAAVEHMGSMHVLPYTVTVPSFGAQNGFVILSKMPLAPILHAPLQVQQLAYLNSDTLRELFTIPPDEAEIPTPVNSEQALLLHKILGRAHHRVS